MKSSNCCHGAGVKGGGFNERALPCKMTWCKGGVPPHRAVCEQFTGRPLAKIAARVMAGLAWKEQGRGRRSDSAVSVNMVAVPVH